MKKLFLIVSLVFAVLFANAQFYVGGSLGVKSSNSEKDLNEGQKTTYFRFNISPEVGYSLNEKMDIGLNIGFGMGTDKQPSQSIKDERFNFYVSPYFRYSFFNFGKFKILGEIALFYSIADNKHIYTPEYYPYEPQTSQISFKSFGLRLSPILTFDISKNLTLFTNINLLSLGFSYDHKHCYYSNNYFDMSNNYTQEGFNFNFGFDMNNITNIGDINIGAIYKF